MAYDFKYLNRRNTDSIKWERALKQCADHDCWDFSIADSDYETAPEIKVALLERVRHGAFGYASVGADYESIIQEYYQKRHQANIDKNEIIPAFSVLNGLSVCLELLTEKDDSILIQTPVYHVFKPLIETLDRKVVKNPLKLDGTHYTMDFEDLETKFSQGAKTLILCHPHNPVGRIWSEQELKQLVDLARTYNVLIISDEIHADVIMPKKHFQSLIHWLDDYPHMIVLTAPTKTFNLAGLKIANIITRHKPYQKAIKKAYERLHMTTPNLLAVTALKVAYQDALDWIDAQNKHIYENYLILKKALLGTILQPFTLEATYLAWIKITEPGIDSSAFVETLAKTGVILSDGKKFDTDGAFLRFNLACAREQLDLGIKRIKDFLEKRKAT